jgi:hypothetical protein
MTAPTIQPTRRVKGKVRFDCPPDGTGYKTRAMRLAEAFGARYSHRSGYVMSPGRAAAALDHWERGFDADTRIFTHDKRKTADLLIPPKEVTP